MALRIHERAVLHLIEAGLATSQHQLARVLGVGPTSVNRMVQRLERSGLVSRDRLHRYGRGRPVQHYRRRRTGPVLAIAWFNILWTAGVFEDNKLRGAIQRVESRPVTDLNQTFQMLKEVRDSTLAQAGLRLADMAVAVLNINATRTSHSRVLSSSVNPWLRQASEKQFSDALGCEVQLDLRPPWVIPELRVRVADGVRSLVVLSVEDGVGAHGASVDEQWGSLREYRGELGHVVIDPRGPLCGCGHRGCIEALISGPAMRQRIESDVRNGIPTALAGMGGKTPTELFAQLDQLSLSGTDVYANTLVEEYLERVAWCVSNVMNVIGPDVIVLSGYGLAGRERWRERILQKTRSLTVFGETTDIRLEFPRLNQEDYLHELARSPRRSHE
ncbi:MAG: ROK family transcriptional regulator [Verrucomicrobia bacterium]|nr:ROK family transcriptional regulator [Verrucomicrobiota bacterium]